MSKIGIIGGTFNPIHNGHIAIANAAYQQFHLDMVWFMPNHIPAYKSNENIVSGDLRLKMIRLAIEDFSYFYASDYELKREGKTYTYETMERLSLDYPNDSFYFIMGADSLFYFEKWVHPEIIVSKADILVAVRDEFDTAKVRERIEHFNHFYKREAFHLLYTEPYNCSSSKIRNYMKEKLHTTYRGESSLSSDINECGLDIAQMLSVPVSVLSFMIQMGLYQ